MGIEHTFYYTDIIYAMINYVERNKKIQPYLSLTYLLIFLRIISAFLIFAAVIPTSIIQFILDWIDGEFYKRAGFHKHTYQVWDKVLDYYWYVFILLYLMTTKPPHFRLFIVLFVFRTIGQFLFFITRKQIYFFLFPNIFEILFFVFVITLAIPSLGSLLNVPDIYPLFAVITVIVFIREYILHIKQMNLSWIFMGKPTYWIDEKPH